MRARREAPAKDVLCSYDIFYIGTFIVLTTKEVGSDFTRRLDERVGTARRHEKWRLEYMTLLERDERMWEEGHREGENLFALLVSKLMKEGRSEDVERAATDEAYRKTLYAEYNLK